MAFTSQSNFPNVARVLALVYAGECNISCLVTLVAQRRIYTSSLRVTQHKSQPSPYRGVTLLILQSRRYCDQKKNNSLGERWVDFLKAWPSFRTRANPQLSQGQGRFSSQLTGQHQSWRPAEFSPFPSPPRLPFRHQTLTAYTCCWFYRSFEPG